jgi:hypothetical protein
MDHSQYKTAIFSGRFDPAHLGHLDAILNLGRMYARVVVVILDFPGRESGCADEMKDLFNHLFDKICSPCTRGCYQTVVFNRHFAEITFSEYDLFLRNIGACLSHSIYITGNQEVIANMKKQLIPYRYYPHRIFLENYIYSGTKRREEIKEGKTDAAIL